MKNRIIIGLLVLSLVAVPLFATACEEEVTTTPPTTTTTPPTTPTTTPTVEANWWDEFGEPQYGGTITYVPFTWETTFDQWNSAGANHPWYSEGFFTPDWTLDRDIFAFNGAWCPVDYYVGSLAESWEIPDLQTWIINIRPGIYWQDKEPVNGREFTADDVVYHYDRWLGIGHGFTEPSPYHAGRLSTIEKVTATDKYTVVCTFKEPGLAGYVEFSEVAGQNNFEAPEVVELYGDCNDWENAVGTGPWILTDYVTGSSLTFTANPNYWGYDERYPENQLPYADELKLLYIPDVSTKLASLRSAQVDFVAQLTWQDAVNVADTNPELVQYSMPTVMSNGVDLRVDKAPFTDIRVRKALEMAIDRETIAETFYAGTVDGIPCGCVNRALGEYAFLYEDWPQELKDEYAYNVEGAKALLAEAAADGVFTLNDLGGFDTDIYADSTAQMDLLQVVQSMFLDIGVDMEIKSEDAAAWMVTRDGRLYEQMLWNRNTGGTAEPGTMLTMNVSTHGFNFPCANDPAYDALGVELNAATDWDAYRQICVQMDQYLLEQHWGIRIMSYNIFNVLQPWLKGYSGEYTRQWFFSRLWIDQDIKEQMGP